MRSALKKKIKKMGRPPADWVHQLAKLNMPDDAYLEYADLCKKFKISLGSIRNFCWRNEVEGEYILGETGVRKRFKVRELKNSAIEVLKQG